LRFFYALFVKYTLENGQQGF